MADKDSRAGYSYGVEQVLEYTNRLHAPNEGGLAAAFEAPDKEGIPAIQVGSSEGKLLELLVKLLGARKAVEIGTLAGYSAIRLARGLGEGGALWTVEADPRHAEIARKNIDAAGLAARVEVVVGAALEALPGLEPEGPFDVVFIDADKGNYDHYGAWAIDHLAPGGLMIGDNAFYFGKLLDPDDAAAAAMRRFHEHAAAELDTVCIPTGDGMLLGLKRS